jgi:hypothetical protein
MSAITLEKAKAKLQLWLDAEEAIALGQSYEIDTGGSKRRLDRADLSLVLKEITFWETKVNNLERGGGLKVKYGLPRD